MHSSWQFDAVPATRVFIKFRIFFFFFLIKQKGHLFIVFFFCCGVHITTADKRARAKVIAGIQGERNNGIMLL